MEQELENGPMSQSEWKINVGSGDKDLQKQGFINLDMRRLPKTDLQASAASLPFGSLTVDSILASDCLEHIPWSYVPSVLLEWHRVLKHGGVLKIKTPNLRTLAEDYVNGKLNMSEYCRRVYGNQEAGEDANFHKSGQSPDTIQVILMNAGFEIEQIHPALDGGDHYNMGVRARAK